MEEGVEVPFQQQRKFSNSNEKKLNMTNFFKNL